MSNAIQPSGIPDLWEIAHLPELSGYTLGGRKAKDLIIEVWHMAHDAKKAAEQRNYRTIKFCEQIQAARIPQEQIDALPQDDEAEEGMNDKRAGFAMQALMEYNRVTGSDLETAIKDLIGDLGHFLDRYRVTHEVNPDHAITMFETFHDGAGMYEQENRGGQQFEGRL